MRKSAILWLIPGILFGLITLGGLAAGGYWIHLTHSKVQEFSEKVDDRKKEVERLKASKRAQDLPKLDQAEQSLHNETVEVANAERDRLIAIIVTSTAVIPGLLTLVFLVMGMLRFMQKPKQPRSADEEEEDEEEQEAEEAEKPPVKKSVAAKPKPADDEE